MAKKSKLFGGRCLYQGQQYRCHVLATSQKQAAEILEISLSRVRDYYCETNNIIEVKITQGFNTGVWIAPLDARDTPESYKKIK